MLKQKVFEVVKQIPKGKVTYFGEIAKVVDTNPRTVGWILSGMPESEWSLVPWQRVIAKNGFVSTLKLGYKGILQIQLLESEGVKVINDHVDIATHLFLFNK